MNEKQFKRLRRLWHQEQVACSRMMYMRQGPALHSSERNMRRVKTLDAKDRREKLGAGVTIGRA